MTKSKPAKPSREVSALMTYGKRVIAAEKALRTMRHRLKAQTRSYLRWCDAQARSPVTNNLC